MAKLHRGVVTLPGITDYRTNLGDSDQLNTLEITQHELQLRELRAWRVTSQDGAIVIAKVAVSQ